MKHIELHRYSRSLVGFLLLVMVIVLVIPAACATRAVGSPVPRFDGTWKATHAGKVILVLRLRAGEHPSGTIQLAGFQLDLEGDGSVIAVTDDRLDAPIDLKNIKIDGNALSFDFVDRDGDTDKFQMEVTGAASANLQWVGLPKGMKAQPIPLTR